MLPVSDSELIQRAIESRVGDIYTSEPGTVVSYDAATQTADIQPSIKRPLPTDSGDIFYEDKPVIPNVKVCFPRGGPFLISWPLNPGDSVILLFCHSSISQWREGDGSQTVSPGDLRPHHLSNAFCLPCLATDGNSIPQTQAGQNAFIVTGPLIVLGSVDGADFAALASVVNSNFTTLKNAISGAAVSPGDGGSTFKSNILSALNFDDVSCQKVKIA